MSDNNNLPQKKDSAAVALQKTTSFVGWASVFLLAHRFNSTAWANDKAVCPPYPTI
jgi:hypothetical protein